MEITGAELLARSLIASGITHVFNVPGLGMFPLLDAIRKHRDQLSYFSGPNETAVTLMADGYGRAAGRPAFVNVYHASGTALAMMGVTTAWADRSPMVFTSTTSSRMLERRDQYASVPGDITDMARAYCKWSWEIPLVERIPEAIARAVIMATTPPMGPVHLALPMDIYSDKAAQQCLTNALAIGNKRLHQFQSGGAAPEGVAQAARMLATAERPLMIVGGEPAQCDAVQETIDIAEMLGAAVFRESDVAYMSFPNNHRLFAGRFSQASELTKKTDAILVLGAEFTGRDASPPLPQAGPRIIALTSEALALGKQIWPDIGLVGNAKSTLIALRDELRGLGAKPRDVWTNEVERHCAQCRSISTSESRRGWDDSPVRIPRLVKEIDLAFGTEVLIVDHSTTASPRFMELGDFSNPQRYFGISARASAQGWGVPAAIGVQIARPDRRVVAIVGDGGFMFTSTCLYAAAQWKTRNVFIVLRNGGWHDVAYTFKQSFGWSDEDTRAFGYADQPHIDYAGLARSLAVEGLCVNSVQELPGALARARDCQGPVLIEVNCDPAEIEHYVAFMSR